MKIVEIENDKINLTIPKFTCDAPLGDNVPPPCPNGHHYMVFVGVARSGKSSTALGLLHTRGKRKIYRGVFENVIVICPEHSLKSLARNPFKDHDPEKMFHELNQEVLEDVYQQVSEYSNADENTLIYIDDMTSDLKKKEVQIILNMLINNRRHLKCSIWCLVQGLKFIPLNNRKLISHLVLFKPSNKREIEAVQGELIFHDKETMSSVMDYVFNKKHQFLFVDVDGNNLYKNFNKLKIIHKDIDADKEKDQTTKEEKEND